jgi:hypothetical protein
MNANEGYGEATRAVRFDADEEPRRRDGRRVLRRVPPAPISASVAAPDLRITELIALLRRRIAARPVSSTLLAVGAGFVLGGALSFRVGRTALGVVGRQMARELLKELI